MIMDDEDDVTVSWMMSRACLTEASSKSIHTLASVESYTHTTVSTRRHTPDGFWGGKHVHTHTCTRTHTHAHTHTHVHTHTHTHTHTRTHTCTRTHIHTHAHIHTRAHTHARTHTHTRFVYIQYIAHIICVCDLKEILKAFERSLFLLTKAAFIWSKIQ